MPENNWEKTSKEKCIPTKSLFQHKTRNLQKVEKEDYKK